MTQNIKSAGRKQTVKVVLDNPLRIECPVLPQEDAEKISEEVTGLVRNGETRKEIVVGVNSVNKALRDNREEMNILIFQEDSLICDHIIERTAMNNGQRTQDLSYCFVPGEASRASIKRALGLASCTTLAFPRRLATFSSMSEISAFAPRSSILTQYMPTRIKSNSTTAPIDMKAHKLAKREMRKKRLESRMNLSNQKARQERRRCDDLSKTRKHKKLLRKSRQKGD